MQRALHKILQEKSAKPLSMLDEVGRDGSESGKYDLVMHCRRGHI